ncbi:MAG: glycerophosphodiester phosphodiesterase [Rhodoferax sp.]
MKEAVPQDWPYPRWIAHRGAGKLAPENTMAAFRLGAAHGYRMFECDVKLSSDGVPFLLHDATLERTTDGPQRIGAGGSELAGEHPWAELAKLDAGSWHSSAFVNEPVPTLQTLAAFCIAEGYALNIEIKPTPGTARHTASVVADQVAQLWQGQALTPLLTSFEPDALRAAQQCQPALRRGLLLNTLRDDWLEAALALGCCALVCNYHLWDAHRVAQAQRAGLRTLSYTVNEAAVAEHLLALGTDGIITDRVDLFDPRQS